MSDLINRRNAIDVLQILADKMTDEGKTVMAQAISVLRDLSSAEPERKHGEWLPHPHEREWDVCSVCGTGCKRREYEMQFGQEKFSEYSYQYCPNCGARLEWEHENL